MNLDQALRTNPPENQRHRDKVILLHNNEPAHTAERVKQKINELGWETLARSAYSPDLALSYYYLFVSMRHALAEQRRTFYENLRIWLDNWFTSKPPEFYWRGIY